MPPRRDRERRASAPPREESLHGAGAPAVFCRDARHTSLILSKSRIKTREKKNSENLNIYFWRRNIILPPYIGKFLFSMFTSTQFFKKKRQVTMYQRHRFNAKRTGEKEKKRKKKRKKMFFLIKAKKKKNKQKQGKL
jgi:hypothetical protein